MSKLKTQNGPSGASRKDRADFLRANTLTEFEKRRGINAVETRDGFAQFQAENLADPVMNERLRLLEAVQKAGISIDFLKFTHRGLSFLVASGNSQKANEALRSTGIEFQHQGDRSIVLVHAVSIRDEDGLIARIIQTAIENGAKVDHLGDMHDRLLMVTATKEAPRLADAIRKTLVAKP